MTTSVAYRWDIESFLRAQAAGVFRGRVELVEGEVWPVVLGDWHGATTFRIGAVLAGQGLVTGATLPSQDSLPDPDVWVRRSNAEPVGRVSARLSRWAAADVLLVVEVADETVAADLTVKAALYARCGYPRYWVVTPAAVHVHTQPAPTGYQRVEVLGLGDTLALPDGGQLPITRLLAD